MKKSASEVTALELKDLIKKYIKGGSNLNYAIKITGHPGVGKSAIVKDAAAAINYFFIDTRLAFKENVDLGGYPVPDHDSKEMIYYRPKFIPPAQVPKGYDGIVWFLDESNRAHPTVIQTLFQIITEKKCGEHLLPEKTSIILAGNLGDEDGTTITEFDDSALDGRLAVFHLKPSAADWLVWAFEEGIHPSIIKYISMYPERLWDEVNINPNPRGWHQVSNALKYSYRLMSDGDLINYLAANTNTSIEKIIYSLIGNIAGSDFLLQLTAPRQLTSLDIIEGNAEKLEQHKKREIPVEDLLWALNGTIEILREKAAASSGELKNDDITMLSNVLKFIGYSRGDITMSYFFLLLRECGIFTLIPEAVKRIDDKETVNFLKSKYSSLLN
ncbi:MAG: AAA family ATPase [Spirochaetota bacterium]